MPSKKNEAKTRPNMRRGAAADPATPSNAGLTVGRERGLLQHELANLQQMNLSLQAVLQMVVSFNKIIEEVSQNSNHLAELNEGWSTFFSVQK
ncbi:hypothetical protein scyTo_0016852 [Scyliorhinus torazame]|uniref:Uncharacterized protein n=1 Tax=Scyliorhinus torazame TaxID=75743 RepID=A0A401PZZ4_SCYTO|nr:hypothetical protein [Scyliorhinus torazame]